jgi:hypothetical protein
LPLPYLIKMVTAVISCCERRDATRRYGRPFPFSFFHMSLLVLVTLLLARPFLFFSLMAVARGRM